jgi:membrane-bound ClpP family serine protease
MLCLLAIGVSAQGQGGPAPLSAGRSAKDVAIVTIHGEIDAWTAFSVKRRIERAERDGANAIVIEINSPGGEVSAVEVICNAIKASQVPNTVAWVRPQAYSGGAIIALACKEIVITDHAQFGDALPIAWSPFTGLVDLPDAEREKFIGPLLAEVVDSARRNGYDEMLVQRFVRRGVELWLIEHPQTGARYFATEAEATAALGFAPDRTNPRVPSVTGPVGGSGPASPADTNLDSPAPRLPEPATALDFLPADPQMPESTRTFVNQELQDRGQSSTRPDFRAPPHAGSYKLVEYVGDGHGLMIVHAPEMHRYGLAVGTINSDAELEAFFGAQNVVRLNETWSEGLARFLTSFWVRGLLIAIFFVCLFVELTNPGVTAPGLLAAVALLALIIPPLLVNMAAWWEIAAILIGIVLIGMELFVLPGLGVCGVLGVVLLFGGLIGTFVGGSGGLFPGSTQGRGELTTGVLTVLISALASGGVMYLLAKHFSSIPVFGRLVLKESLDDGTSATLLEAMASDTGPVGIGAIGRALTPLRPAGRVLFDDQVIDAVAEYGFIAAGSAVRVVAADGFRIAVEALPADATDASTNPGSV